MNPEDIQFLVEKAIKDGMTFPWWSYALFFVVSFGGGFFASYLSKKAENLATKEDFENLLDQVKRTTKETESIKIELEKGTWLHQQTWGLKVKYYTEIIERLYSYKHSLSSRLDFYIEPGSEHWDHEINKDEHFMRQIDIGYEALSQLREIRGPAEIVISTRSVEALDELFSEQWEADFSSSCNSEFLDKSYGAAKKAHAIIIQESRSDLL